MASERSSMSSYRAELTALRSLSAEHERELAERWKAGDPQAGRRIVEACLPFVMTIAYEYRRWGLPAEDIVQEGNIGLLKAAQRFDPERGCRLVTYAAYWIRAEIRDYVVRGYRIVRIGSSKGERRALRIYRKTRERDPKTLAALSGLTEERVVELLPLLLSRDVSLDLPAETGGSALDRLAGEEESPEEAAVTMEDRARTSGALRAAMEELPPREREIVERRWLTEEPQTLEALGRRFGVSKERVRQIEERAKARMRASIEAQLAQGPSRDTTFARGVSPQAHAPAAVRSR
jgi:RNA polymerase sigma-32 factor